MRKLLLVISLIVVSLSSFSQYGFEPTEKKESIQDRFRFGGGLGLSFGTITQVAVSPRVDFKVIDRMHVGLSTEFLYYKNTISNYEAFVYGISPYIDFLLAKDLSKVLPLSEGTAIVFHAESSFLNLSPNVDFTANPSRTDRFWLWQPLIGGGIKFPAGRRSYIMLLVLFNANERAYSPYSNPIINLHLMF